jgi:uncharacterized protein YyaL (SSP411 family)
MSYFHFARQIVDAMIERFYDAEGGGFFDTQRENEDGALGALRARRKPFQDSPTPAANSAAVIALLRMHSFAGDSSYREKAAETLEVFASSAPQYGIFAATYGIAAVWLLQGHTQVVVLGGDERADQLYAAAVVPFAVNKAVIRVRDCEIAPHSLPPALAESIPSLPGVSEGSVALVCTNFSCQPPISDPNELATILAARG